MKETLRQSSKGSANRWNQNSEQMMGGAQVLWGPEEDNPAQPRDI